MLPTIPRLRESTSTGGRDRRAYPQWWAVRLDPAWLPKHDALSQKYVDQMLEGIVNFSIPVARIETRWKLSQNRGRREQELIAAELEKSDDVSVRALAALTRKHYVAE